MCYRFVDLDIWYFFNNGLVLIRMLTVHPPARTHARTRARAHTHIYTYVRMYIYTHTCMYVHVRVRAFVYVVYKRICTYVDKTSTQSGNIVLFSK